MNAQERLARLVPSGASSAARTPFALLLVLIMGTGLLALLLLNSSLNQGSFQKDQWEKETNELTDEQQALQEEVDRKSAPDALERRARELGLVPGGDPAFLFPDGRVRGSASPAPEEPKAPKEPEEEKEKP
ncbi:septum formation initiator family protein [Streptomyces sp. NPDC005438]|uniref:septum formation initiator family protein n=1 Tax=Streptomyces sp. NPDC005438 TaxID=3156880 RepID=UPI00339DC386